MRVTRLKVSGLRALEQAELSFQPGFNLVVGVNGVGKTTILDALGVCLSAVIKETTRARASIETFSADDIRRGSDALTVECGVSIGKVEYSYLLHKPRSTSVPQRKAGMPRAQVHETPARAEFLGTPPKYTGKEAGGRPLAVLFSTRRALPSDAAPLKSATAGGTSAAYAGAFSNRELRIAEFAAWIRAQYALKREKPGLERMLTAFEDTVRRFLPHYKNIRVDKGHDGRLVIDRGKVTLHVKQLSDGERGALALVLDLTRRLAQANPQLEKPASQAEAVVLIDELELHLHPKWQRTIVGNLTSTFPKCQFIATTHSPQIIGEVAHDRILIIDAGQVYPPGHSFGVDSSRVLEEIMGAEPRTHSVDQLLHRLSKAVNDKAYDDARRLTAELEALVGENDPEVTRARTLLQFMEGDS